MTLVAMRLPWVKMAAGRYEVCISGHNERVERVMRFVKWPVEDIARGTVWKAENGWRTRILCGRGVPLEALHDTKAEAQAGVDLHIQSHVGTVRRRLLEARDVA